MWNAKSSAWLLKSVVWAYTKSEAWKWTKLTSLSKPKFMYSWDPVASLLQITYALPIEDGWEGVTVLLGFCLTHNGVTISSFLQPFIPVVWKHLCDTHSAPILLALPLAKHWPSHLDYSLLLSSTPPQLTANQLPVLAAQLVLQGEPKYCFHHVTHLLNMPSFWGAQPFKSRHFCL